MLSVNTQNSLCCKQGSLQETSFYKHLVVYETESATFCQYTENNTHRNKGEVENMCVHTAQVMDATCGALFPIKVPCK